MLKPKAKGDARGRAFPATSWSMIRHLKDSKSFERERHLDRLVGAYWQPVFCVIRHVWAPTADDAKDLTQQFFLNVVIERGKLFKRFSPERGSFRAFLKGAIAAFIRDRRRADSRQKRGGQTRIISLEGTEPDLHAMIPGVDKMTPEEVFDAAWCEVVFSRALAMMEEKLRSDGRGVHFDVFRRYDLAEEDSPPSYKDVATELGLSVDRVKHALVESRTIFRDIVTHLVREYVDGPDELEQELRRLFG